MGLPLQYPVLWRDKTNYNSLVSGEKIELEKFQHILLRILCSDGNLTHLPHPDFQYIISKIITHLTKAVNQNHFDLTKKNYSAK